MMFKPTVTRGLLVAALLACATIPTALLAQEPHSADAHAYEESIYGNHAVMTLPQAIERALQSSPRLRSTTAARDAAQGAEVQAGYRPNPQLNFEAENIAGSGQLSGTRAAEYTLGVSQKIELGGKRQARQQAALASRSAAEISLQAERMNLARDVHIAYSDVLAEAEAMKLAIDQEQLAKDVRRTVANRVDAAAEPEIQLSKADVAYSTSVIAREREQRQLRVAKARLARLWGESTLDASLDHEHFFELAAPAPLEEYQAKLADIPDMQKLSYLQDEKKALWQLEQAQATPDPSVSLGVRDFEASGDQALVLGVSLPLPVRNRNQGAIAQASAYMAQAQSDAQSAQLALEQELIENWQHWNASHSEATRLKDTLLPAAEKAFRLAREGYEKGRFAYLEVLDAQRTLFDARTQYHESLKRYHASRARVERLTTSAGEEL